MATISSMAGNTYMMYKMAQNNGLSLFGNNQTQSSQKTSTFLTQWQNVQNTPASQLQSYNDTSEQDLATIQSIRSGINGLTSSYTSTRTTFYAEYDSTMDDLKSAAQLVKGSNFSFSDKDITQGADGKTTYSEGLQQTLDNVKNLVSKYNDALQFTQSNAEVSTRVKALGTTFADTTYRASQYGSMGISVDSKTGALSVDESKLAKAIVDRGEAVQYSLGSYGGLAGKAEHHADLARSQRSRMFPSMQSMIGGEMEVASLYSGKTLNSMTQYTSVGNLLNFMF